MPSAPPGNCGRLTPPPSSDRRGAGEGRTQRPGPMKPVNLGLHATSLGGWISSSVSIAAGGDAAAAPTLAAIDLLAALR